MSAGVICRVSGRGDVWRVYFRIGLEVLQTIQPLGERFQLGHHWLDLLLVVACLSDILRPGSGLTLDFGLGTHDSSQAVFAPLELFGLVDPARHAALVGDLRQLELLVDFGLELGLDLTAGEGASRMTVDQ